MLPAKIRKLLNGGAGAAGVEGLTAAINAITAEVAQHKAELGQIPKRRSEAALADDGEVRCAALTTRETELYASIEVAEIRIGKLREKLREQINLRRLDRIEHHRRTAREKFEALRAALRAAVEANEAASQAYAAAAAELGAGDAFSLVSRADYLPPGVVVRDMVENWELVVRRELDGAARTAPRSPAPSIAAVPVNNDATAKIPHGAPGKGPIALYQVPARPQSAKPIAVPKAPAVRASQPKRSPIRDHAKPGEVLVELLRSDYEDPSQRRCMQGDVISLRPEIARSVVGNGIGEFVKGDA